MSVPAQRTPPRWASIRSSSDSPVVPSGAVWRTTARSNSWPSRKMSAETSTMSPTHRLIGYAPPSTAGSGSWITIRAGGDADAGGTWGVAGSGGLWVSSARMVTFSSQLIPGMATR